MTLSARDQCEKIEALDLSMVIRKMETLGWQRAQAMRLARAYKNYLIIIAKYGAQYPHLPPSKEIDEFWHNHILDTQRYAKDCEAIFGRFLHHDPYVGFAGEDGAKGEGTAEDQGASAASSVAKNFATLQELHKKEFGDYIYKIRKFSIFNYFK